MNAYFHTILFILQETICLCSGIGSLMIISQVCRNRFNRSKPQQRLILGISISDFVTSIVWMLTPALMRPTGEGDSWLRSGNQQTCSFQGFMITLFVAAGVLYQGSIQLQYLLAINYGWTQRRLRKIEAYLHAIPWIAGCTSAITNLVLKNYNPADWDCWIAPYPSNCTQTYVIHRAGKDMAETCVRGDNAYIYQWAFFWIPLWSIILFCLFVMFRVYNHVYTTESRTARYKIGADKELKMAKEVKSQSILYACAFLAVWLIPTIARIIQLFGGTIQEALIIVSGSSMYAQGIWNAIIYFKPRYQKCDENLNPCQKVMSLMNSTLFYWVTNKKAVTDVIDVVVYGEVTNAPGKAVELGDEEEVDIDPPPRETRKTWSYSRTTFRQPPLERNATL